MSDAVTPENSPMNSSRKGVLRSVLVDGQYTPSLKELSENLKKIDAQSIFRGTEVTEIKPENNSITFSFAGSDEAHLFTLFLMAKGFERDLFSSGPSDNFFDGKLLDSYRVDGYQFAISEKIEGGRSVTTLKMNYKEDYDPERKKGYTNLVKAVVNETMPNLAPQFEDFTFN